MSAVAGLAPAALKTLFTPAESWQRSRASFASEACPVQVDTVWQARLELKPARFAPTPMICWAASQELMLAWLTKASASRNHLISVSKSGSTEASSMLKIIAGSALVMLRKRFLNSCEAMCEKLPP